MSPSEVAIVFEARPCLGTEFFRTGIVEAFKDAPQAPPSCELEIQEPGVKGFDFGEVISNVMVRSRLRALAACECETPLLYMAALKFEFVSDERSCQYASMLSLAYREARLIGRNFEILTPVPPLFQPLLKKRLADVAQRWPSLQATSDERALATSVIKRALDGIRLGQDLYQETQCSGARSRAN